MADLDRLDRELAVGQVKSIYTDTHLDYVEMKFGENLSAQLAPIEDNKIQFDVKDNDFRLPDMSCQMEKSTLRDLIVYLKELYKQLGKE